MADSGNSNYSSLKASSQNGTQVDLKAKLRKVEINDGMLRGTVKWWIFGVQEKTFALVFDEVEEGGPLHQCGIRNGDELITVNNAEVNNFDDVSHIASVIRGCSLKVMLGMRRRRRQTGSVPFVVLFEIGDTDSNPVHKFCGFYWNVSPRDIPFIQYEGNTDVWYKFNQRKEDVEVIGLKDDKQNWLTFKEKEWTFQTKPSDYSLFQIYKYTKLYDKCPVCSYTPVILVPQNHQECALDATQKDKITTSPFKLSDYDQKRVHGSGLFLKVFGVDENIYHIKSTQTDSYLELEVRSVDDESSIMVPVMTSSPTTILLNARDGTDIFL